MKKIAFVALVTLQSLFVFGQIKTNEVSVENREDTKVESSLKVQSLQGTNNIGVVEIDGIANEPDNNYVRGSVLFSRDGDLDWNTSTHMWTLGGGGSNDFTAIIHDSGGDLRLFAGPPAVGGFNLSNADFRNSYERMYILGNGDIGMADHSIFIDASDRYVGINQTSPQYRLDVNGTIKGSAMKLKKVEPSLEFYDSNHTNLNWRINLRNGRIRFGTLNDDDTNFSEKMSILNNGNVGVGHNKPAYKFQVGNGRYTISANADQDADIFSTGGITIKGNKLLTLDDAFKVHASVSFQKGNQIEVPEGQFKFHGWYGFRFITRSATEAMMIQGNTGNVGIGTTTPNEKLHVAGKIRATGQEGWSDFVFYDDYVLPTLEEVESHIEERGHLKDIPSEAEVLEEGIDLTEMDSKLL